MPRKKAKLEEEGKVSDPIVETPVEKTEVVEVKPDITTVVSDLTRVVYQLANDLKAMKEQPVTHTTEVKTTTTTGRHLPQEYRELLDQYLNKNFDARVTKEGVEDIPGAFNFTIICPDKYSTMSQAQRSIQHEDIRPKVIMPGEGFGQVQLWVETVWSSFNPTMQAIIAGDR